MLQSAVRAFKQLGDARGVHPQAGERRAVIAERVPCDVQAGDALLMAQPRAQREFGNIRQRGIRELEHAVAKEGHLPGDVAAAGAHGALERGLVDSHQLRALCARAVECAGEDQRLDDALVDLLVVHPLAEVEDVLVLAALLPRADDGIDRLLAAGLDRAEAEADARAAGCIRADGEFAA